MAERQQIVEISCIEVWREISAYLDNDVTPELRERLEYHFKRCKHCIAVVEGTRNVIRLVGDDQAFDLPTGFSERLFAGLEKRIGEDAKAN